MKLKVKFLGVDAGGKPIVFLNREDAEDLGIRSLSRVRLKARKEITCLVNITSNPKIVGKGYIGFSEEVKRVLKVKENEGIEVEVAKFPISLQYIREKLKGRRLSYEQFYEIVKDVVERNLSEVEIAGFISALNTYGLSLEEAANLSLAMVNTGKTLDLKRKMILDKHSIGGSAGDKTSMILVPIIASLGYTIPKTSSRAITSAAGTADKVECLMPVALEIEEMEKVVKKTNGCLVWGGTLGLAPADDIFIQIEYPLGIDPLLFPSIMSKKKAVGATHLVIDIPTGRGTKVKTIGDANFLAKDFIQLGNLLGIKVNCAITYGEQPIGNAIGPALEAREALEILMRKKIVPDQIDKVLDIAALLLELVGKKDGKTLAKKVLETGKAERKLREIIKEQGGDPKIKPEDIPIGEYTLDFISDQDGFVFWIDNNKLIQIARAAGAPKDKGAGVYVYKKVGDKIRKGEIVLKVFAERERKLTRAEKILEEEKPIGIGERAEMLIQAIKEKVEHKKTFILER